MLDFRDNCLLLSHNNKSKNPPCPRNEVQSFYKCIFCLISCPKQSTVRRSACCLWACDPIFEIVGQFSPNLVRTSSNFVHFEEYRLLRCRSSTTIRRNKLLPYSGPKNEPNKFTAYFLFATCFTLCSTLKVEAASLPKMSANLYRTTWH
jgi:hypothetical protein